MGSRSAARASCSSRGGRTLEALRAEIGAGAEALPCDLADAASMDELIATVSARLGGIDVLVNNAGHSIRRTRARSTNAAGDAERLMAIDYAHGRDGARQRRGCVHHRPHAARAHGDDRAVAGASAACPRCPRAAELVAHAVVHRPPRIGTPVGELAALGWALNPSLRTALERALRRLPVPAAASRAASGRTSPRRALAGLLSTTGIRR